MAVISGKIHLYICLFDQDNDGNFKNPVLLGEQIFHLLLSKDENSILPNVIMGTGNTLFNVTEKIRVRTEGETSSLILILLRKLPTKEFS